MEFCNLLNIEEAVDINIYFNMKINFYLYNIKEIKKFDEIELF